MKRVKVSIDSPAAPDPAPARGLRHRLLWALPFAVLAMPAWQAWHSTCRVPWADHWTVLVEPWMKAQANGSWATFIHAANNDSRHDVPRMVHAVLMRWTGWNLLVESFVCVLLCALLVWASNRFWRRHPAGEGVRLGMACLSALFIASPMQWMNWTWGIQICCLTSVAGAAWGILTLLQGRGSLLRRAGWAGALAAVASFSFANGWLAWMTGAAALAFAPAAGSSDRRRAAGLWCVLLGLTVLLHTSGGDALPPPSGEGTAAHDGLLAGLLAQPVAAATFFLKVAGAPFSEVWFWGDRATRVAVGGAVASGASLLLCGVLVAAVWHFWRVRRTLAVSELLPWGLLIIYGLANSAAIAAARFRMPDYSPFQSRYPSYTLWWLIGVAGLVLALPRWHPLRRVMPAGLVLAGWCWLCGAWQGWADDLRIAWHSRNAEAAVALRHVAMEPMLLHRLFPEGASRVPSGLDALEAAGFLNVRTLRSAATAETPRMVEGLVDGQLLGGRWEDGGPVLRGWAMDLAWRTDVRAVLVSFEPEGGEEQWLGVASRRTREPLHAQRRRARVLEDRIGWRYEPAESYPLGKVPVEWRRRAVPPGRVRFRAWAFDALSGTVHPLRGEVVLDVPAPSDSDT